VARAATETEAAASERAAPAKRTPAARAATETQAPAKRTPAERAVPDDQAVEKHATAARRAPAARANAADQASPADQAATADQTPAAPAIAAGEQADAVKDPGPASTKKAAKIPAGRKAVPGSSDPVPAATPAKATKRAAAKKAAPAAKRNEQTTTREERVPVSEQPEAVIVQDSPAAPTEVSAATIAPVRAADPEQSAADVRSLRRLPELAAVAAVKRFAPQAAEWAREVRTTYPTATPDGLARLAQRRFARKSTATGAAASFANGWSAAADLAGTGWVNAELITHIAAAYGKQATAADILVLTGVHQDHASAQAAIDGREGHSASRAPITAAGKTATWAALKILTRWWPGLAAAGGAATASLNTERIAARAIQRFRGR
jgi:hypothetical protein